MTPRSLDYNPAATVLVWSLTLSIVSFDASSERGVDPAGKGRTHVDANEGRWTENYHQSSGGYELAFSGVVFALIGLWLDRRLGTVPVFTLGLTVLGFTGAVANIYYRYRRDIAREDEAARLRKAGS